MALSGCRPKPDIEKAKAEIKLVESEFERAATEKGISDAFYAFADVDATINRGTLIHGRLAIREFYENAGLENTQLKWSPDSVFVSQNADMGYTYGKYTLISTDNLGKSTAKSGIFHTIWKKQKDGRWKHVWD
jgi:ketosteroid isomerase-like protein